ncbi:MAG TPA: hypothetical protein VGI39_34650 [Polyangiaceae bacterium]|jgi:hypothetical protein
MRTAAPLFLLTFGLLLLANRIASADPAPSCRISVLAEARWNGYGFNHLVHLVNSCSEVLDCNVSTDVNPQEQTVTVAAHTDVVVNTFVGAPGRVFTPRATCTARGER